LEITTSDPQFRYHPFVNNYFVISPGCSEQLVMANSYEGFARRLEALGVRARSPRLPITRLPSWRGSIKCISNQAPGPEVFQRLGIPCCTWQV
jgi:hypothetical protein